MYNEFKQLFNEFELDEEQFFNQINKRIIKAFSNKIDTFDMKTILGRTTKEEIYYITKNLGLKGVSSLNKAKLIDVLIDNYEQLIYSKLILFDKSRFKELENIVKNKGICTLDDEDISERASYYATYGLIYPGSIDEMPACVMPSLVMDMIKKYSNDFTMKKTLKINDEIITLTKGMLEAYGVISIENLTKKLNMYGVEKNEFYIETILLEGMNLYDYYIDGEFIVNDYIDYEEIEEILHCCSDDYEFIDKEEIRAMSKEGWIANTNYGKRFIKEFKEFFCIEDEVLIDVMESMWLNIQYDDFDHVMSKMLEDIKGQERIILRTITSDFLNSVRLWNLRGRSMSKEVKKEIVHSVKVGRNDPCPCGSGKKYKKCCGKNK